MPGLKALSQIHHRASRRRHEKLRLASALQRKANETENITRRPEERVFFRYEFTHVGIPLKSQGFIKR
jgi:hypothetical protein